MIHLTSAIFGPISINPFHIFMIARNRTGGSYVTAAGGFQVEVTEPVEEVEGLVKVWAET